MKQIINFLALFFSFLTLTAQDVQSIENTVRYLASPELEGRKIQTKGDTLAFQFIERQFQKFDAKPFFTTYYQPFCLKERNGSDNKLCSSNVVALVEGTDKKLKDQYIVVGAHFDHLGKANDVYFAGANDNASGVASVLYLAEYFAKNPTKRSLIFACFAGEESGLWGSTYFVKNFPETLQQIAYMVNFDMVGRYDQEGICIIGETSAKLLSKSVNKVSKKQKLILNESPQIFFSGSDHYPFYQKNIPVICFNTGKDNKNYHRPADRADSIDYKGIEIVADVAKNLIIDLGAQSKMPVFQKIVPSKKVTMRIEDLIIFFAKPEKFGFVSNTDEEFGNIITIEELTEKGIAAGLQIGDIVIKINGKNFTCALDLQELAYTEKKPPFRITVIRGDDELTIDVE